MTKKEEKLAHAILLIDDDKMVHKLLSTILQKAGYEVISAYSGEEGLNLARISSPELIILDIMMPGLDGFDVMRLLQADPALSSIPVIFLSGKIYPTDKLQARDLGAADFIEKPFDRGELLARVKTYLKMRRQEQDLDFYAEKFTHWVEEGLNILHQGGRFSLKELPGQLVINLRQAADEARALNDLVADQWRPLAEFAGPYMKGQPDYQARQAFEAMPQSIKALSNAVNQIQLLVNQLEALQPFSETATEGDIKNRALTGETPAGAV